jgi:hypothetical protein
MASDRNERDANPKHVITRAAKKQQIIYDSSVPLNVSIMNNFKSL